MYDYSQRSNGEYFHVVLRDSLELVYRQSSSVESLNKNLYSLIIFFRRSWLFVKWDKCDLGCIPSSVFVNSPLPYFLRPDDVHLLLLLRVIFVCTWWCWFFLYDSIELITNTIIAAQLKQVADVFKAFFQKINHHKAGMQKWGEIKQQPGCFRLRIAVSERYRWGNRRWIRHWGLGPRWGCWEWIGGWRERWRWWTVWRKQLRSE